MNASDDYKRFHIAKKFAPVPPGTPGFQLRSLFCDPGKRECRMLILGEDYTDVRQTAASYKEETGTAIGVRARGKSLEFSIQASDFDAGLWGSGGKALSAFMAFACCIPFAGEEIREFFLFYNNHLIEPVDEGNAPKNKPLFEGTAFKESALWRVASVEATPEAGRIALEIRMAPPLGDEDLFESAMPLLHRYDMGLLKISG